MIEINLIPDVKQELIKARRVRTTVIAGAIIIGIASVGIVILLAVYVFGAQTLRNKFADDAIKSENSKLQQVKDLPNMLTVQNQLTKLSEQHGSKMMSSRAFDALSAIIPSEPNNIAVSRLSLNSEEGTITVEGQAANGYPALETFKKTIDATKIVYAVEGEDGTKTVPLASDIVEGERSYGDDEVGRKVLRFSISFTYPKELFARDSKNTMIAGPSRTNATDSFIGIPQSLFTNKATDSGEEK